MEKGVEKDSTAAGGDCAKDNAVAASMKEQIRDCDCGGLGGSAGYGVWESVGGGGAECVGGGQGGSAATGDGVSLGVQHVNSVDECRKDAGAAKAEGGGICAPVGVGVLVGMG